MIKLNTQILSQTYEIHITIRCKTEDIDKFKSDCVAIGVKPIVLDLQSNGGASVMQDVMTSSKYVGETPLIALSVVEQKLYSFGYEILRKKLETTPYNLAVPTVSNELKVGMDCYFESHLQIETTPDRLLELRRICQTNDVHLSRNIFKEIGANIIIMATLRKYDGWIEQFSREVEKFYVALLKSGFYAKKIEVEYAIYDSNVHHDREWVEAITG